MALKVVKKISSDEDYVTAEELTQCCIDTVDVYAEHNKMIVCGKCNKCLKLYETERTFQNYCNYCKSRKRFITTAKYGAYFIVLQESKIFQ